MLALGLVSCSAGSGGGPNLAQQGGFLSTCAASADCDAGLDCVCGLCTTPCGAGSCGDPSVECAPAVAVAAWCGAPPAAGVCLPVCDSDDACASFGEASLCRVGFCAPVDAPVDAVVAAQDAEPVRFVDAVIAAPVGDAAALPVPDAGVAPVPDAGVARVPDAAVAPVPDAALPPPDLAVRPPPTPDGAALPPDAAPPPPAPDAAPSPPDGALPVPDGAVPVPDAALPPPDAGLPPPDPDPGVILFCGFMIRPMTGVLSAPLLAAGHTLASGCAPDADTLALLVLGGGSASLDGPTLRAYVQGGGRVVTSIYESNDVFNLVFETAFEDGIDADAGALGTNFGIDGSADELYPIVQMSPDDPFWQDVGFDRRAGRDGMGHSVDHLPGITPLGGWQWGGVWFGYRDLGAGRLWLADMDWLDGETPPSPASARVMAYLIAGRAGLPPACMDGLDDDADGRVDLADPGCVDPADTDEADEIDPAALPTCANGRDDDADGVVDFPDDRGCEGRGDPCETPGLELCDGQCTDLTADPANCGECGNVCAPGEPCGFGRCGGPLSLPGVQTNFDPATLRGWRLCWDTLAEGQAPLAVVDAACAGEFLAIGCRMGEPERLDVLAMGLREEVLRDTGVGNDVVHVHNNTAWFHAVEDGLGFLPPDVSRAALRWDIVAPRAEEHLWAHTIIGLLPGSGRCGTGVANAIRFVFYAAP